MFGSRNDPSAQPAAPADPPVTTVAGEVIRPSREGSVRGELDGRRVLVRFFALVTRLPRYVKLGWLLMNDPTVSGRGKVALGGGLAYAISPIDPVPGFIPVLGQIDDIAVLLLAVRLALKSAPTEVAERRLQEVGLSWELVERDLVTVRATAVWIARRGSALAVKLGKSAFSLAMGSVRDRLKGTNNSANGKP